MAPVANLRTMLEIGSTSSTRTGCGACSRLPASVSSSTPRMRSSPRSVISRRDWSSTSAVYSLKISYRPLRVACCSLKTASGLNRCGSAVAPPLVFPAALEAAVGHSRSRGDGVADPPADLLGELIEAHAGQPRGRAREAVLDHLRAQADGLEDLRAGVGGNGGHAHLGHDLQQPLAEGREQVGLGLLLADPGQQAAAD